MFLIICCGVTFIVILSISAKPKDDRFRFKTVVPTDDYTVNLDVGHPHNVTLIEWGDGTVTQVLSDKIQIHVYKKAGEHVVSITGSVHNMSLTLVIHPDDLDPIVVDQPRDGYNRTSHTTSTNLNGDIIDVVNPLVIC
jgi:hypothetical protein